MIYIQRSSILSFKETVYAFIKETYNKQLLFGTETNVIFDMHIVDNKILFQEAAHLHSKNITTLQGNPLNGVNFKRRQQIQGIADCDTAQEVEFVDYTLCP